MQVLSSGRRGPENELQSKQRAEKDKLVMFLRELGKGSAPEDRKGAKDRFLKNEKEGIAEIIALLPFPGLAGRTHLAVSISSLPRQEDCKRPGISARHPHVSSKVRIFRIGTDR
ncbi:UNVERIFIED_CONTAM: hypothetical protein K2H54_031706 [Gekko kuhli]